MDPQEVTGNYSYWAIDKTLGEPTITLSSGGGSMWQNHGCEPVPMAWGIEVDDAGAVHYQFVAGVGATYRLWVKPDGDCQLKCTPDTPCDQEQVGSHIPAPVDGKWDPNDYSIYTQATVDEHMFPGHSTILGERFKEE
jgi:hypothetical protein